MRPKKIKRQFKRRRNNRCIIFLLSIISLFLIIIAFSIFFILSNKEKSIPADTTDIISEDINDNSANNINPIRISIFKPEITFDEINEIAKKENRYLFSSEEWLSRYVKKNKDKKDNIEEEKTVETFSNNKSEYIEIYPDIPLTNEIKWYIYNNAIEKGLNFKIVLGCIYAESRFNHNCEDNQNTNGTYDVGLFQINSNNFEWMRKNFGNSWDPYDIYDNIDAGLFILKYSKSVSSNDHGMMMVYNMGENGAKRNWNSGVYSTPYSRKVVNFANELPDLDFE